MDQKACLFTYPEEYMVYLELGAKRVGIYLPYYFTKAIQNAAEDLGAEIHVDIWWPFIHVVLIRNLEKEVEECVKDVMNENREEDRQYCEGECGDDQKCIEECLDEIRAASYHICRDELVNKLRPAFLDKMRELKREAELYGIVMQTGVVADREGIKLKLRIEGYNDVVPLDLGKALFYQMLDVAHAKHFTDVEKFSHIITSFLIRFYKVEEMETLVKTIDKSKIYISRVYEDCCGTRKYEMTINYNDDKIKFLITEKKLNGRWVIVDVAPLAVLSSVADLTPA
jgi:hypothetical protein